MNISVIIPCKNEAGTVENLLDDLVRQTTPVNEVVVVDSHSSDNTAAVARGYSEQLPIKVIAAMERGVSHARNEGAAAAAGDMLIFLDADAQLPANFIAVFRQQIAKRGLEAGGFSQRMAGNNLGLKVGARLMGAYQKIMSFTAAPIAFSCFFATKAVHEAINGLDPQVWIMEDYDYAYRAKKSGAKFGIIRGTYFIASPRRFEQKAGLSIGRALYAEIYRYTHGMRITKPLFTYDMGGEQKSKNKKG